MIVSLFHLTFAIQQHNSMRLPPPCLTVGEVIVGLKAWPIRLFAIVKKITQYLSCLTIKLFFRRYLSPCGQLVISVKIEGIIFEAWVFYQSPVLKFSFHNQFKFKSIVNTSALFNKSFRQWWSQTIFYRVTSLIPSLTQGWPRKYFFQYMAICCESGSVSQTFPI